ncbi:hypothetical protein L9F63_027975, partial [Diploptera punctata]
TNVVCSDACSLPFLGCIPELRMEPSQNFRSKRPLFGVRHIKIPTPDTPTNFPSKPQPL